MLILFKFVIPTAMRSFIIFSLSLFLSTISAIKMDDAEQADHQPTGDTSSGQFPVSFPPIKIENGKAFVVKPTSGEQCLFYAEGLSVVIFDKTKSKSAWADYDSKDNNVKYTASMTCQGNQNMGSSFEVYLKIDGTAKGYVRGELGKQGTKNDAFTVDGAEFMLHFNFTQVGFWQFVNATVMKISLLKGSSDFLTEKLDVNNQWKLSSSVVRSTNINGFKDYSFACGRTNPIVWEDSNDKSSYAVGITLNNVQFQPFNATFLDGGNEADHLKFGWRVSDCQGLFTIGTWMGLVVASLLIGVLFFGLLMLNSVQTMDRFDDPKQKQLIISSKE